MLLVMDVLALPKYPINSNFTHCLFDKFVILLSSSFTSAEKDMLSLLNIIHFVLIY